MGGGGVLPGLSLQGQNLPQSSHVPVPSQRCGPEEAPAYARDRRACVAGAQPEPSRQGRVQRWSLAGTGGGRWPLPSPGVLKGVGGSHRPGHSASEHAAGSENQNSIEPCCYVLVGAHRLSHSSHRHMR